MKHLLTLIFSLLPLIAATQICNIDYAQTQVGIYPDTLPSATVSLPYNQDITFVMPTDTLGYDFINFHILSVALPVGLGWTCNNSTSNCNYNPQIAQHGCVNIHGTPLLAGSYTIDITVLADLTILSGYPFVFQIQMDVLPPTASISNNGFTITGAPNCTSALVSFTNNNPGLLQYQWDFGNGNLSFAENPGPQYYPNPGAYVVTYTAYGSLDTTSVYTLENLNISSMSNYGGGFPSYENADAYFKIKENGTIVYQSTIIGDQNPPVQWTLSFNLNPSSTYVIEIWEADDSFGEPYFGADDYIGSHNLNLNGCNGCGAGTSNFNYSINHQVLLPTPQVLASDTIVVYDIPATPLIAYDSLSHTLSTSNLGYSYQWYFNGSPLAGATAATHEVYQSGSYSLVAINANGCVAFSDTLLSIYCSPWIQPVIQENNSLLTVSSIPQDAQINWFLDGQLLANQNANYLQLTQNGNYQCQITDAFGCQYETGILLIDASVIETKPEAPLLFPNPNNGLFQIQVPASWLESKCTVSNLSGQIIWEGILSKELNQLDLQELVNGTYLLELEKNQIKIHYRLIKTS